MLELILLSLAGAGGAGSVAYILYKRLKKKKKDIKEPSKEEEIFEEKGVIVFPESFFRKKEEQEEKKEEEFYVPNIKGERGELKLPFLASEFSLPEPNEYLSSAIESAELLAKQERFDDAIFLYKKAMEKVDDEKIMNMLKENIRYLTLYKNLEKPLEEQVEEEEEKEEEIEELKKEAPEKVVYIEKEEKLKAPSEEVKFATTLEPPKLDFKGDIVINLNADKLFENLDLNIPLNIENLSLNIDRISAKIDKLETEVETANVKVDELKSEVLEIKKRLEEISSKELSYKEKEQDLEASQKEKELQRIEFKEGDYNYTHITGDSYYTNTDSNVFFEEEGKKGGEERAEDSYKEEGDIFNIYANDYYEVKEEEKSSKVKENVELDVELSSNVEGDIDINIYVDEEGVYVEDEKGKVVEYVPTKEEEIEEQKEIIEHETKGDSVDEKGETEQSEKYIEKEKGEKHREEDMLSNKDRGDSEYLERLREDLSAGAGTLVLPLPMPMPMPVPYPLPSYEKGEVEKEGVGGQVGGGKTVERIISTPQDISVNPEVNLEVKEVRVDKAQVDQVDIEGANVFGVGGSVDVEASLKEDPWEKSVDLTYDFSRIPAFFHFSVKKDMLNMAYYKYKPLLEKAERYIRLGKYKYALDLYQTILEQNIPEELKEMIEENMNDIRDYIKRALRHKERVLKK